MDQAEHLIRNISDTALLAAVYRARETERKNPLFRDPLARRLAGQRGDQIAASIPFSDRNAWAWVIRLTASRRAAPTTSLTFARRVSSLVLACWSVLPL